MREEKLSFILKSSPNARVVIVAPWMGEELKALLDKYDDAARAQVLGKLDEASFDLGNGVESVTAPSEAFKFHNADLRRYSAYVDAINSMD